MIILAVVLVGAVSAAVPKTVRDRITNTFTDADYQARYGTASLGGVGVDASVSARLDNWTGAAERFLDSPIWGLGVTGFGFVDSQYPRILIEVGLLGLAAFIYLIATVFREAMKVVRAPPDAFARGLATGVMAGTVGLLVHALAANTFTIVRIMEPFWLSVGMVAAASALGRANSAEVPESE
jgi:O-antigen ligase